MENKIICNDCKRSFKYGEVLFSNLEVGRPIICDGCYKKDSNRRVKEVRKLQKQWEGILNGR